MPSVNQSALVPYSAAQMYALVNDYERYPEFLPGCVAARTVTPNPQELTAELTISKAGISQRFTTRNRMTPDRSITMRLAEGPFEFLHGRWTFDELDEQCCKISLDLEFEFSNPVIALAFGRIFTHLTGKMVDAFKQRAKAIYH